MTKMVKCWTPPACMVTVTLSTTSGLKSLTCHHRGSEVRGARLQVSLSPSTASSGK